MGIKTMTKIKIHNAKLTANAKVLRKSMTEEERKLWYKFLRKLPFHISRQKCLGNYIVDFYCASAKLIIEIDGSQHFEDEGVEADKIRDKYFSELGMRVIRYTNLDVNKNFENVCKDIYLYLKGQK